MHEGYTSDAGCQKIKHIDSCDCKQKETDMTTFYETDMAMEMALPMDMVAEEVVMQDEVGAEVELNADVDNVTLPSSIDMLSRSRRELCYPDDSSEDEDEGDTAGSRLCGSGPNAARDRDGDVWTGHLKDDCLCWECGERFKSLELLMGHFRKHEAHVCCNLCHVTFRRVVSLSMHLNNVHNNVRLFCTTCHLSFESKWDLNEHLGKHADLSDPPVSGTNPPRTPEKEVENCPTPVVQQDGRLEEQVLPADSPMRYLRPLKKKSSPQSESCLTGVVAKDHAYNNRTAATGNGKVSTTYALRVRHTKTLTKVFPRDSLPESAHQKKIRFFVFRSVDQRPETEAKRGERDGEEKEEEEGEDGEREGEGRIEEEEEEAEAEAGEEANEDTEPDMSSWIAPLPDSMASPDSSAWIKQESMDPDGEAAPWEGEPIEEEEEVDPQEEEEEQSDSTPAEDSDYDPDGVSDASSESFSSGNSSGSSYSPRKRRKKRTRSRGVMGARKQSRAGASQESPAVGEVTKCPHYSKEQRNLLQHLQICERQKAAVAAFAAAHFPSKTATEDHKAVTQAPVKPSRMYACDACREVFPEQVTYRRHHCPKKAASKAASVASSSAPTPIPGTLTVAANVQAPAAPPPAAPSAVALPAASSLLASSTPSQGPNGGAMKVTQVAVPCAAQSTTVVSPLSVSSGPGFSLPGIVLTSSSAPSQPGPRPIMATVVFNGSSASGRVARVVLQSQGLTFPTQTLSQTQPVRLSVPAQAKTLNPSQGAPSVQLTNLLMGGIIQPQTLIRSPLLTAQPPGPGPVPVAVPTPTPAAASDPAYPNSPALIPVTAPGPAQTSSPAPEPLKILGLFVNRSQELALQQRLNKSWRSKSVFLCRQCGAVSRQPSLGVRHRYLHRGSRRHRCHCGRAFQRRLHLLRHHIQHAEATRFVCAPCGETFTGARCLARHKQGQEGKRRRRKKARPRKGCQAPFSCDCGQLFQRPTAFLWHKLKNPKRLKRT
ncbi:hypothetical protein MATL_G00126480 [Megalops atlanticus]|uniref:C2H2-type domain-containing protein n=1 Tax=Megalops atlanticus TaxID=7932 RepID=A0A9D3PX43_MEGAT|nr:hypothetical protein MATL_G00126480 [Megalops atlanticus]